MKLAKGKSFLKLPAAGEIRYAHVLLEGMRISLVFVSPGVMQKVRKAAVGIVGRPVMADFTWIDEDPILEIFPAADQDYQIEVAYYPPMCVV